ncbi:hypothetical protein AAFF_G00050600 [Aldrovandia affinis]|uniref:Uncharacterized protein n=1 Tax=Aldrovandia affinis TaxID=143900 RepID=A0AAD7T4Q8_9TELE|nr:hypothetical protein AAFF_G00050600 [Aldrovandia affinis]
MSEDQKSQLTDITRATASIEGKLSEVLGRLSDVEGWLNFLEDAAAEVKANPAATAAEVESLRRRLDEMEDRSLRKDALAFITETVPALLGLDFPRGFQVERAHRSLGPRKLNRPDLTHEPVLVWKHFDDLAQDP